MEFLSEAVAGASAPMALGSGALALAATAYLDAKFGIRSDVDSLREDRAFGKLLQQRIAQLGDSCTIYKMLERVVEVDGKGAADALWFENETWSYTQLKDLVDRFAAHLSARGVRVDDLVAVFTTNSPEMVVTIYALSKLGAVAALINTSLRGDTFTYCLNVSTSRFIIATPDLVEFAESTLPKITIDVFSFGSISPQSLSGIDHVTADSLWQIPKSAISSITPARRSPPDVAALVYTSGTTGRPKACAIRNSRLAVTSTPTDLDLRSPKKYFPIRTYCALPLFHGTALFGGLCYSLGTGGTLCLRRKFSASKFWKDVHDSGATRVLYIGELCRYLLGSPPSPYDRDHKCLVAYGNGLRGEIWDRFRGRFNVPEIREIYRATEGVARFDNAYGGSFGAGCVGFHGPIRRYFEDDTFLIRYDPDTEMPYRDPKTGFCVKVRAGEAGEAIGRVRSRSTLTEYLNDAKATEKKILRDVFEKGDVFQRMGDLLLRDNDGWIRFHDRVGDTFRWKGENVSAGEVRDHICRIANVQDAVVYGVKLANYDGKAGAAGITLEKRTPATETAFMADLYRNLKRKGVPSYALPRLVRITKQVATSVTFKQAKGDLTKRGWNPDTDWQGDTLYWLNMDPKNGKASRPRYEKLDKGPWVEIESGRAKI